MRFVCDVGIERTGDSTKPIEGVALPIMGVSAFIDHNWSDKFSSSLGYSFVDIDNAEASADDQFSHGDYAIANLAYYPCSPGQNCNRIAIWKKIKLQG